MSLTTLERQIQETLERFAPGQRFLLGCSGGLDSMTLLWALNRLRLDAAYPFSLRVVHVDHQLQTASGAWAKQVQAQATLLGLDVIVRQVSVAAGNLEQEARRARYQAYRQVIAPDEVLILAHHQQDQAETVLMRLFNGSGVSGLAAMREVIKRDDLTICRPLLSVSRADIQRYALEQRLSWVDDPANHDLHYERVVLRHKIWPLLHEEWPGFEAAVARTASLMADAAEIVTAQGDIDLSTAQRDDGTLEIACLQMLSEARVRWVLARWMQGKAPYPPPYRRVEAVRQMMAADPDAEPRVDWRLDNSMPAALGDKPNQIGVQFRRYQGKLYRLSDPLVTASSEVCRLQQGSVLYVASGVWRVERNAAGKRGLSEQWLGQALRLRPRLEGERLHLAGRIGRWPLKKILQSLKLPPWQREQVQILETLDTTPLALLSARGCWLVQDQTQDQGWILQPLQDETCDVSEMET